MGIFKKLKDVLFDIEEDELPIITKNEEIEEGTKKIPKYKDENTIKEIKIPKEEINKKELETTFNFPLDIDDEDKPTRRSKTDYNDSKDYLNIFEDEIRPEPKGRDLMRESFQSEKRATRPFKTTPIISPVYGILDQNYSKDDVIVKTDIGVKGPNLDEVRKKAYGIEDKKSNSKKSEDNKVTIEEFDDSLKTLDEILMEEEKSTKEINLPKKKEIIDIIEKNQEEEIFTDNKKVQNIEDDTIETDLFNLIDSMYEDKEEREEE